MSEAAALIAMLLTIAATIVATRMRRDDGFALLGAVAGLSLSVLYFLGADSGQAVRGLGPVLMIIGYASIGVVLNRAGVTALLSQRLGDSPVAVLLTAAVASTVLSNDIVVVAFAPVVLLRRTWRIDIAALFIGANLTGGLLPQGSPTNLLVLGDLGFVDYLKVSFPVSVAMASAGIAAIWAIWALVPRRVWGLEDPPEGPDDPAAAPDDHLDDHRPGWTRVQKVLVSVAAATIALQPLFSLFGLSRAVLGWVLLLTAVAMAKAIGLQVGPVISSAPWQIIAVVLVLLTGAGLLSSEIPEDVGSIELFVTTFFVSALGTDILAAALAAPLVLAQYLPPAAALVAVSAGAFATPVGSLSGILVFEAHQVAGRRPAVVSFAVAGGVSLVVAACGLVTALLV